MAFDLKLGQSKPIYNAFKAIRESPDWEKLSDARKRIVEGMLINRGSIFASFRSLVIERLILAL